jgi:simple sugar transport system ATP-binding protein
VNAATPLIRLEQVSVRFGRIVALENVSFAVPAGAVTCLLGDNGAGKSTLIRVLSGVIRPTSGRCIVDDRAVTFTSPRDARDHGIATVHQDLALVPLMSIWRNFFLGAEPTVGAGPFRRIAVAHCRNVVRENLAELGIDVRDPDQPVGTLSGGERQSVAIARALHFGARILILDEPTAALGVKQAAVVLRLIARARDRGVAVVFITHNPHHALAVGDRFVVLRRGRLHGEYRRGEATVDDLTALMSGGAELATLEVELAGENRPPKGG